MDGSFIFGANYNLHSSNIDLDGIFYIFYLEIKMGEWQKGYAVGVNPSNEVFESFFVLHF